MTQDATITIAQCQRIKPDGARCGSPAMRSQKFCYHHIRPPKVVRPKAPLMPVDLTDTDQVSTALNYVFRGMVNGSIPSDTAKEMLKAISLGLRQTDRDLGQQWADLHRRTGGGQFHKPVNGN